MIDISVIKTLQFTEGKKELRFDVSLPQNTIIALYGDSGAGKTTALKLLAGLVKPEWGTIKIDDEIWYDSNKNINIPTQQRSLGFVFQDYALFPNMTVKENLLFAAGNKPDIAFINHLVNLVSLDSFLKTKPAKLSGGQQQRVALIRALVRKPKLLLLDEPLAAVDVAMRQNLHKALRQLQNELHFTALLVSHDISDVYALAKQVVRLEQGRITFVGTPQELFGTTDVSSKLQLTATILSITPNGAIYIVEALTEKHVVKITATAEEASGLQAGDTVLLYAKAFQLGIQKMI